MNNKYILISSTSDRFEMLKTCVKSINTYIKTGWTVVLVLQEYNLFQRKEIEHLIKIEKHIITLDKKVGPHSAKIQGLKYIKDSSPIHIVCSIDDDVKLTNKTDFTQAATVLMNDSSIGLLSLNWVKHSNSLEKKQKKFELVKQIIVYTGGGLMFNEELTDIILNIGDKDLWCDNTEWSIQSYINGYNNYRWRGSISVHNVCQVGGRRGWVNEDKRTLPDPTLIDIKHSKTNDLNNYLIPTDKDVLPKAKELHKNNLK